MSATFSTKTPAAYRRAVRVATTVADTAATLAVNLEDGYDVQGSSVRELARRLGAFTRQGSGVDESTRGLLFSVTDHLFNAEAALLGLPHGQQYHAQVELETASAFADQLEDHVRGLFG